jgi:4-hydroxythreonine-4-phosphate dehydrogenase
MTRPRIAITMGDPAGIGPEICLRLLSHEPTLSRCVPIVFGDADVLARAVEHCGFGKVPHVVRPSEWQASWEKIDQPCVFDLSAIDAESITPGVVSKATGQASYEYIEAAINAALAGQVDAVATGPIHKKALNAVGFPFPGHTELFAAKTNTDRYCMMLTCDEITCSFVTAHVGYHEAPALLSVERILEVIELSHIAMSHLRGHAPKLVVCGLNPHAGEGGLFGNREEERFIAPAVRAAHEKGIDVEGPLPPDTAFLPFRRRETDCFICMYHDQGHIPLKALAFDVAVNITLGLPIIRTSVDHGTALDIAWQGRAEATSMIEAVKLATRLAESRTKRAEIETA